MFAGDIPVVEFRWTKPSIDDCKIGKGSIDFKHTEDFPVDLMRDIFIHRIKEIEKLS